MVKIAILASGRGSNFSAIMKEISAGRCAATPIVLITNNPLAPAIEIAKKYNLPVEIVKKEDFSSREEMSDRILFLLYRYDAELVVLAGYMLLIKGKIFTDYKNRIINIHPSFLPAFPGANAQKDAFEAGAKVSGLTIHFVDESLDGGPIIYQEKVDISDCKSADEAAAKILTREHLAYPKIVHSFSKGNYSIEGKRASFHPTKF